ncbi:hypothetical protein ROD_14961 [Citrobacter rodentium ICC168]|uniref:Uncharacterized protein n=1 Tax=Citrobacter rodentium (strain ICC168) TaxID=637910 RepID=D2TID3_CITRI|nr:hypothetical protein ROD_14961 [Citrobacter rodentium ICC168]
MRVPLSSGLAERHVATVKKSGSASLRMRSVPLFNFH